ncbi:MAG: AmmeMemoRadiSam system protein B [Bacteroidales bacterium]|nr:AmmeMemoRadiSam system protein B [Bacteroidales bacterium]
MKSNVRKAYVAGKFYPDSRLEIYSLIDRIRQKESGRIRFDENRKHIIGGILPHAGHVYSGYQTVHFFEILSRSKQEFDSFVILYPIHRSGNIDYACDENEAWSTPLGILRLDKSFIEAMDIPVSDELHKWEHSAEVILPFIQVYNFTDKNIVPIGICWQHPDSSREIAIKILKARDLTGRKICILASSDFSHFVDPDFGSKQDQMAIDEIIQLNPEGLYKTVLRENISMCGYGPIMALLYYLNSLDIIVKAEVLARGHSGMVLPGSSVVDYVSMVFYT